MLDSTGSIQAAVESSLPAGILFASQFKFHARKSMKFSLKTMLISFCAVGAILGIMGRLLTERPEDFLWVMTFFSTVVPFVLAGGTIIWLGLRSKELSVGNDLRSMQIRFKQRRPAGRSKLSRLWC